jgi:hypothetical protein
MTPFPFFHQIHDTTDDRATDTDFICNGLTIWRCEHDITDRQRVDARRRRRDIRPTGKQHGAVRDWIDVVRRQHESAQPSPFHVATDVELRHEGKGRPVLVDSRVHGAIRPSIGLRRDRCVCRVEGNVALGPGDSLPGTPEAHRE